MNANSEQRKIIVEVSLIHPLFVFHTSAKHAVLKNTHTHTRQKYRFSFFFKKNEQCVLFATRINTKIIWKKVRSPCKTKLLIGIVCAIFFKSKNCSVWKMNIDYYINKINVNKTSQGELNSLLLKTLSFIGFTTHTSFYQFFLSKIENNFIILYL